MISTRCLGAKQNAVKRLNHGDLMRYNLGVNGDSSIQTEDFLTGIQTLMASPTTKPGFSTSLRGFLHHSHGIVFFQR